jgi:hypothetical protein
MVSYITDNDRIRCGIAQSIFDLDQKTSRQPKLSAGRITTQDTSVVQQSINIAVLKCLISCSQLNQQIYHAAEVGKDTFKSNGD